MPRTTAPPPARTPRPALARLRRSLLTVAAGLALGLAAAPAYAHDELRASNPADGASLTQPPAQVVLTFEEPPVELGAQVVVTGPDGPVSSGSPQLQGEDVIQSLRPGAPAGRYSVEWRVTSGDGHPVSGSFGFTAQAAAAGTTPSAAGATPSAATATASQAATPAPAEEPRPDPLIPSWAWIIAGVIVIAAAIRVNRRASAADRQED